MCDPLKLLRYYTIKRKEIVEKDDRYIFDNISFKKTIQTSVLIHGTKKKHYYTLECLIYFLKYSCLKHIVYMRQAAIDKMPVVLRENRRSLLNYLYGHTTFCEYIDQNVIMPKIPNNKVTNSEMSVKKPSLKLQLENKDFPIKDKQKKSLKDVMSLQQIATIRAKYIKRKESLQKEQNNNNIKAKKCKEIKTYLRVKNMNGLF